MKLLLQIQLLCLAGVLVTADSAEEYEVEEDGGPKALFKRTLANYHTHQQAPAAKGSIAPPPPLPEGRSMRTFGGPMARPQEARGRAFTSRPPRPQGRSSQSNDMPDVIELGQKDSANGKTEPPVGRGMSRSRPMGQQGRGFGGYATQRPQGRSFGNSPAASLYGKPASTSPQGRSFASAGSQLRSYGKPASTSPQGRSFASFGSKLRSYGKTASTSPQGRSFASTASQLRTYGKPASTSPQGRSFASAGSQLRSYGKPASNSPQGRSFAYGNHQSRSYGKPVSSGPQGRSFGGPSPIRPQGRTLERPPTPVAHGRSFPGPRGRGFPTGGADGSELVTVEVSKLENYRLQEALSRATGPVPDGPEASELISVQFTRSDAMKIMELAKVGPGAFPGAGGGSPDADRPMPKPQANRPNSEKLEREEYDGGEPGDSPESPDEDSEESGGSNTMGQEAAGGPDMPSTNSANTGGGSTMGGAGSGGGSDTDGAILDIGLSLAENLCLLQDSLDSTGIPGGKSQNVDKYRVKPGTGCHVFKWKSCRKSGPKGKPCGWFVLQPC